MIVESSFLPQAYTFTLPLVKNSVPPVTTVSPDEVTNNTWRRVEIGPGIELHVHFEALSEQDIERLRGTLLRELGVIRGWFDEQKK